MLDSLPIWLIGVLIVVLSLVAYEVGFRAGRWWQDRLPGEQEGPSGVMVGSLLALIAFLLAVTMGMASDRFDHRRTLVLDQANAIDTVYLRAGYLAEPTASQIRALVREYAPLQVGTTSDLQKIEANAAQSIELQQQMWSITEAMIRDTGGSDVIATFVESLNDLINTHESRVTAVIYGRVPSTVLLLLIAGAILSIGVVGYSAGVTEKRSLITAVVLIIALGATIMLVIDLDRPRDGFITVSQQPILDVIQQIGATPP